VLLLCCSGFLFDTIHVISFIYFILQVTDDGNRMKVTLPQLKTSVVKKGGIDEHVSKIKSPVRLHYLLLLDVVS